MRDREQSVMEQYELGIISTRRGRGFTIYETNQGSWVLKPIKGSPMRMKAQILLLEELKKKNLFEVEGCMANKEGEYVSRSEDGEQFILKEYLNGREWNMEDEQEVIKGVALLGMLHKALFYPKESAIQRGILLSEEVDKHNRELKRTRNYIRERKRKTPFELLFLQVFSDYYREAEEVQRRLPDSKAEALWQKAMEQGSLCHGDFTYHNLIYYQGKPAILNFEKMYYGVQIDDFYQFFRKVMEKNSWNQNLAGRMLETYKENRSLSREEAEYLYLRFAYPEKFWKLANHYFNGKKTCTIEKDFQKLSALKEQNGKRREFLAFLDVWGKL